MHHQDPNEARYVINRITYRLEREFTGAPTDSDPVRWQEVQDLLWALQLATLAVNTWKSRWLKAHTHPVTKWDLISDKDRQMLERTSLGTPIICRKCGEEIVNEAEFAKHFVVTDIHFPNLGKCWTDAAPEYAGSRPEWPEDRLSKALPATHAHERSHEADPDYWDMMN